MKLTKKQLVTFTLVTSEANWLDYFGVEWPTKAQCLQGRLRPLGRADGKVAAQCPVIDSTPDKLALARIRGRLTGPSLKDICERDDSEVFGGDWPQDRFQKLHPKYHGMVLRARVYRHREPGKSLHSELHAKNRKAHHHEMAAEAKKLHKERRVRRVSVRLADVQPGDVLEMTHVRPSRVAGEK